MFLSVLYVLIADFFPLFEYHLPEDEVYLILKCLSEGNGIRATSRIVGVSEDTVGL